MLIGALAQDTLHLVDLQLAAYVVLALDQQRFKQALVRAALGALFPFFRFLGARVDSLGSHPLPREILPSSDEHVASQWRVQSPNMY